MNINHIFEREGDRVVSTTLSWASDDQVIELRLNFSCKAVYSKKLNEVVIEYYKEKKVIFYSVLGELMRKIPLVSMEGYSFRELNKSKKSRSGVSLIFFPIDESKKTKWNDMVQYELLLKPPYIGEYLGIYR